MNMSCSSGPHQGDPACPHPVLGDLRVRQAIDLAVDKQALVHGLMADKVKVAGSLLPVGPYTVDLPPSEFNPNKAQQLLDQAGWVVGSDGIRTKGGVRAHLTLINGLGNRLAEETAQVIAGDLQAVGIETESKELPPSVLGGGFATNSPFTLGNFDLVLYLRTVPIDPQAYLHNQHASDQVPSPQLQTGNNVSRIQDPRLDQALAAAGNTLDDTQRQAAYVSVSELIHADEAVIPLFPSLQVDARKNYLQGWQTNGNDYILILLAVFFGTSFGTIVLIIGLLRWMPVARLVRAVYLQQREREYVLAARALGASTQRLTWRHILPNAIGPVIVAATLGVGGAILTESALSFLGLGIQLPTPSWGNMLRTSQTTLTTAPWLALAPGAFVFLTIVSINYIGDGLRDALDPRSPGGA